MTLKDPIKTMGFQYEQKFQLILHLFIIVPRPDQQVHSLTTIKLTII